MLASPASEQCRALEDELPGMVRLRESAEQTFASLSRKDPLIGTGEPAGVSRRVFRAPHASVISQSLRANGDHDASACVQGQKPGG